MTQKASSDGTTYRDRSETGTLNEADEAVTLAVEEQDSFACQITTGLTGTLVAEVSVDGGTTYAATEFASKAGGATSSSLVNPGTGAYDILRTAGCTHVRVRCSAYTSGSAAVTLRGAETPPATAVFREGPPGPGGELLVAAAGTAEQLSSQACSGIVIYVVTADPADMVYVGDSTVDSSFAIPWPGGTRLQFGCTNANQIWVDADADDDGIKYQVLGA